MFVPLFQGSTSVIGINLDYSREGKELDISEKAFDGMSNLQFLKVYGHPNTLQLTGGLNYLSHKLRLLDWRYFPVTCFPCNVNLEFLVELIMIDSKLEKLWEGIKVSYKKLILPLAFVFFFFFLKCSSDLFNHQSVLKQHVFVIYLYSRFDVSSGWI